MIIKFNAAEVKELRQYDGAPFGEDNFKSFMAEMSARTNDDQADIGRDDRERIETHRQQGHGEALDKVFTRPLAEAFKEFFG